MQMIQLGFASAILPDLTLPEVMKFAAEVGFDCVEVMCCRPAKRSGDIRESPTLTSPNLRDPRWMK